MVLYNLKNMEILVEVPQEILDGIARGEYLDDYEVPYLEFGNFMADFENNSEATVCLPKISVHHN